MFRPKILVAMSGGVDSSVAAALLVRAGYDVTGAFMINYDGADVTNTAKNITNGCWVPDYRDAVRVAAKLGIPLLKLDFQKEYKKLVLDYMFKEYEAGRTPNPDVLCNTFIKFCAWLKTAKKLGFDKLATGHYARLKREMLNPKLEIRNKSRLLIANYQLLCAKDTNKDQTYFLHQLTQEQLRHVLFPLGDHLKSEVRKLAKKFNLPTAEKEESMGICFVGEVNMRDFLQKKIKAKPGNVVMSQVGANCCPPIVIGRHEGLAFYTIGQRHLGKSPISNYQFSNKSKIQNSKPLYVVDKDTKNNRLIVGFENDILLHKKEILVQDINWIGQKPKFPLKCEVRLRHRQPLQVCHCEEDPPMRRRRRSNLKVKFEKPQRAPTPGQFAVFYAPRQSSKGAKAGGELECLGGGVIA